MITHTTKQIDELASILVGEQLGRSASKDKALARLKLTGEQTGVSKILDITAEHSFEDARQILREIAAGTWARDPSSAEPKANTASSQLAAITSGALELTQAEMDAAERVAPGHWRIGKNGAVIEVVKTKAKNEFSASVGAITEIRRNYYASIRAAVAAHNQAVQA